MILERHTRQHVEERIQVDGVPISHAELAARMDEVADAVKVVYEVGGESKTVTADV